MYMLQRTHRLVSAGVGLATRRPPAAMQANGTNHGTHHGHVSRALTTSASQQPVNATAERLRKFADPEYWDGAYDRQHERQAKLAGGKKAFDWFLDGKNPLLLLGHLAQVYCRWRCRRGAFEKPKGCIGQMANGKKRSRSATCSIQVVGGPRSSARPLILVHRVVHTSLATASPLAWQPPGNELAASLGSIWPSSGATLDIGCGTSSVLENLSRAGCDIALGLDGSAVAIEAMQARHGADPRVHAVLSNLRCQLPFRRAVFDTIVDKGTTDSLMLGNAYGAVQLLHREMGRVL